MTDRIDKQQCRSVDELNRKMSAKIEIKSVGYHQTSQLLYPTCCIECPITFVWHDAINPLTIISPVDVNGAYMPASITDVIFEIWMR
jgi:hypothetical protein